MKTHIIAALVLNFLLSLNFSYHSIIQGNKDYSIEDSASYYINRAHTLYNKGNINDSKKMYSSYLKFDEPKRLKDVILEKRLFFVPDSFAIPNIFVKEKFIIKPIKESHTELDYKAVMNSVEHLTGVIGRRDWPGELTLEEDRIALKGHEWEFEKRVGFVYTVLNKPETEVIGCIYIYPSRLDRFDSEVVMWVTEENFKIGLDEVLFNTVDTWIKKEWPFNKIIYPGREISWGDFFERLEKQDRIYLK